MRRPFASSAILVFALFGIHGPLQAQPATLARDINLRPGSQIGSDSRPAQLHVVGDRLFFTALAGDTGREVWVTDGTTHGTELLADVCPGRCNSNVDPVILGSQNGLVFWAAPAVHDQSAPFQLWRSDGTRAGTFALSDASLDLVLPDRELRTDTAFAGGLLYFMACPGGDGPCALWSTNGSRGGTREVLRENSGLRQLRSLTGVGNRLFFLADLPSGQGSRRALWVHDGTSGQALVDFGGSATPPRLLTAAGNLLFFVADGAERQELWVSDGTQAGTRAVSRFTPAQPFRATSWLAAAGGRVYFVADDQANQELWTSDGTPAGTVRLTDFAFGEPFGTFLPPSRLAVVNGRVVFAATDGLAGYRLWAAGGGSPSQALLSDLCTGGCEEPDDAPDLVTVGSRVLFLARDATHGREPWSTDGTPQGTALVHDTCTDACGEFLGFDLMPVDGAAVFVNSVRGQAELWRTDGTAAGTRPWTDLAGQASLDLREGPPVGLGDLLVFTASNRQGDGRGLELWASDGNPGGTRPLADLFYGRPGSGPEPFLPLANGVAFIADDGERREVWRSAGTPETTFALSATDPACLTFSCQPQNLTAAFGSVFFWRPDTRTIPQLWKADPGRAGSAESLTSFPRDSVVSGQDLPLVELGGSLYFLLPVPQGGTSRTELWRTDGTAAGTREVGDVNVALPRALTAAAGRLYFLSGGLGRQLWTSDGTAAGTRLLSDEVLETRDVRQLTPLGGQVFFTPTRFGDLELWAADGTPEGTRWVRTLVKDFVGDPHLEQIEHRGSLYIAALGLDDVTLWRSDGTAEGTILLRTFPLTGLTAEPVPYLTALGDRVYFAADDGVHGLELWQTDGTAAGTTLFFDLIPGGNGSAPAHLYATGGRLFFAASDAVHGVELWESDGTAAGTRMVQDVAPQSHSASPLHLTAAGGRLYFSADDGVTGREPWSLFLGPGGGCQPSATALCLSGGRFQVESSWLQANRAGQGQAVPLTGDTGYFWFFGPENVEVIVKVLDGRGLNDHFWVFYGALSDVEYSLKVTDTVTGLSRLYRNLPGRQASVGDTNAFGRLGAFKAAELVAPAAPPARARKLSTGSKAACQPAPTRLCLNGGRFAAEVRWTDFAGHTGQGTRSALTDDTGAFWFFGPENLELVVKVLDGTAVNGRFWVFYGALSNVGYELTVTDTATGEVNVYTNPAGRFASVGDTGAF